MNSLLLVCIAVVGYLTTYKLYGHFLADRIFQLDPDRTTPAHAKRDDVDYCPARTEVLFGHHYTSIAGTGPIVGPALAVIWGWVPAFIWILVGPIIIGGIHDFGALVISARNEGQTIGDTAGQLINPRVRVLFQILLFFLLLIVIAIFGMVIANIFAMYPSSVIPIWAEIPIAMALGEAIYRRNVKALPASLLAIILMYATILIGRNHPIELEPLQFGSLTLSPVVTWTIVLMIYAYVASILPVWRLLQPRDYINGHELYIVLALLGLGVLFTHPAMVAPTLRLHVEGAPPIFPFLFITVACGAVSGFHSLVSSGTTSKQLDRETDALPIGFGSMLLEGLLAILVLVACGGGLGIRETADGLIGSQAWQHAYESWKGAGGLAATLGAFVTGSANMIEGIKPFGQPWIHHELALTLMGVFVASFAGTTLDTAARIQRYIVSEVALKANFKPLTKTHPATLVACGTGLLLAMVPKSEAIQQLGLFPAMLAEGGKGGLILWPLFGAGNQLLAGLGLLVVTVYLLRLRRPAWQAGIPMVFMIAMTIWAMLFNIRDFQAAGQWHLLVIGCIVLLLDIWMVIESAIVITDLVQHPPEPPSEHDGPAREKPTGVDFGSD